ncbi:TPA: DJ-1/PfpI family protein [Burkholderia aenigmatica]|uniref:DJ-1/PfpI family protein n=1 Tax=Burkholderia sp. AU45251 TaxID=3059204 RepID=UPI002656A537|nr:AraC family transcriptional regulator [Burkholderia sp. AU45251]HDR9483154.1 DJ-1/PfpI family protein [Burkholderia aenigmatica]MDN7516019.1 DJ-1/PfpI family protein [Burkholderia sp. AU45251]HDR9514102.1 DJ-1/PfpI family protein [Burkholderia aenigmatica]HDR9591492.1 DJ-1/PfpI family protein [Burkholderia aenigmatica]HDR9598584.1 DJ-1/PfpI family protein [Burkholderia aenigmatica]
MVIMLFAYMLPGACAWGATQAVAQGRLPETRALTVTAPKEGRTRPLVAIIADNAGTETTDFIVPYSILKASGAVDVVAVSVDAGAVELMPALRMLADTTIDQFDAAIPAGADVVVVPAMHRADRPAVLAWLKKQAAAGATMVAICDGAVVLANAGLLRQHTATSHWYSRDGLRRRFTDTNWVGDRRYVMDGNVMTTAGVSASIPASIALVGALAGPAAASETARRIGVQTWSDAHDSGRFGLTARRVSTALVNRIVFWKHETFALPLENGFDEISVALTADAWARTWRSDVIATADAPEVVSTHGLRLLTQPASVGRERVAVPDGKHVDAVLPGVLADVAARYGAATSNWVALQLEYATGCAVKTCMDGR